MDKGNFQQPNLPLIIIKSGSGFLAALIAPFAATAKIWNSKGCLSSVMSFALINIPSLLTIARLFRVFRGNLNIFQEFEELACLY